MSNKINIKIASFMAAPDDFILESLGLGSSVAVCLYDSNKKAGGMARIMAPDCKKPAKGINPLRFVNEGIDHLLQAVELMGCDSKNLKAKIFGGASLFPKLEKIDTISKQNIQAVKQRLNELNIEIIAEDTGGNKGRSVLFNTKEGSVTVNQIGTSEKRL